MNDPLALKVGTGTFSEFKDAGLLASMFEQAPGFMALFRGPDHIFELANPAYLRLVGKDDLIGKPLRDAIPEAVEQGFVEILDQVFETGEAYVGSAVRAKVEGKSGEIVVDFVNQPIRDSDGNVTGIFVQGTDVTERARAEMIQSAQRSLLEAAVQDAPLNVLLSMLVQSVEDISDTGVLGSVLLLDKTGERLTHGAGPSLPDAYNEAIDGIEIGPEVGSCGTAAFTGKPVFVSDIDTDPLWKEFRSLAGEHRLKACWSMPIKSIDGQILGTFAMYYREPRAPNSDDLALVEFVTTTAAIIIERKRAEDQRKAMEERSQRLLQALPVAIYTTDENGQITFYNEAAVRLWGHVPDLGNDRWCGSWKLFHSDGRPMTHDECPMALSLRESRPIRDCEAIAERPDGTRSHFIPFPTPLYDESGKLVGAVNTLVDITERRRTEIALEDVSRRLDAVLNNTRMAVFLMDDRQHCIFANAAAEKLTGYTFEELRAQPLHDVIHHSRPDGTHYPLEECPIDRAFPQNAQTEGEEIFVHRDGHFYPVAFTASPIRDDASKTVGTVIEVRDTSEERARAAELAEALNTKEILLHEVNHRVKNSLQVVTSLLTLQANKTGDQALKESLQEARNRISVVASMHQRLYSTSEHDRVDFGDFARDLAREILEALGATDRIALKYESKPGLVMYLGQAVPLALIVNELITNAVKYAFPDGSKGIVELALAEDDEGLSISIADNGGGLPDGFAPETSGGLGMKIVTALVRQLRATLDIDCTKESTTFRIHLPQYREAR